MRVKMKLIVIVVSFLIFSTNLYAQSHPYKGLWALVLEEDNVEDHKKRCKDFNDGIYNNLMVISDDQIDQVNFNQIYVAKIQKMQRLKNTAVDIVDLSWQGSDSSRELWVLEAGNKDLVTIGNNGGEGWHYSYKKCD